MAADTQTENSKIRPNHTQTPNVYFDQYMAFLTGEEWKCLCYTVRRTMGFQRPSAQISTVQYASGLTTKDGKRLDFGTGLSRPAVAKAVTALVTFGLLIEVKPPRGNAGGVYELQLDDTKIDHDAIMNRSTEQAQKKRQRTAKMLQVRLTAVSATYSNKSDLQGAVSATDSNAASATYSNPVARKKEKESLGNKDSLQPAAGASVAGASEVPDKAVEPASIKEGIEPVTTSKTLPRDDAGKTYLNLGNNRYQGPYAPYSEKRPAGTYLAAEMLPPDAVIVPPPGAVLAAKAKQPKAPKEHKPPDPVFRWVCDYLGINADVAWKSQSHAAFPMKSFIVAEEKGRLQQATPLTDEQLAAVAPALDGFIPWYHKECKDCALPKYRKFQTWIGKWYLVGRPNGKAMPAAKAKHPATCKCGGNGFIRVHDAELDDYVTTPCDGASANV